MKRRLYASCNRFQWGRLADKRAGIATIETIICSAACPVLWFREPEHHRDRASLAIRFAGQSQVSVWPMVRRMNRCPLWRKRGRWQGRASVPDFSKRSSPSLTAGAVFVVIDTALALANTHAAMAKEPSKGARSPTVNIFRASRIGRTNFLERQPAQQDSLATSFSKPWAASLSPSTVVR